jgi:hypothetical protein
VRHIWLSRVTRKRDRNGRKKKNSNVEEEGGNSESVSLFGDRKRRTGGGWTQRWRGNTVLPSIG